jgi:phosphotriesterase-related protein
MSDVSSSTKIQTVTGPLESTQAGIADAHNHVWISRVPGTPLGLPVLDQEGAIAAELVDYRQAGGGTILDCQPGVGCGRDGRALRRLSSVSGVHIVASTGYHLQKYYPQDYWLFSASSENACRHFTDELTAGLEETRDSAALESALSCAGFIKIACEDTLEKSPLALVEAAVGASLETGAAVLVHTEKGADAERIAGAMLRFGLPPGRLVLCHMDKRPDFSLHQALASQGITLEYDTFYRPKYEPEKNLWPLLIRMVEAGLHGQVVVGTDIAEPGMWTRLGGSPGLTGLVTKIIAKMEELGFEPETIQCLAGKNIARRLAK